MGGGDQHNEVGEIGSDNVVCEKCVGGYEGGRKRGMKAWGGGGNKNCGTGRRQVKD